MGSTRARISRARYVDKSLSGCAPLMHSLELPPGMPPMLILGPAHLAFRSLLGFAAKCVFTLVSVFDSSLPRVVLPDIVCLPQASAVFCGNVCMFVCVINSLSLCVPSGSGYFFVFHLYPTPWLRLVLGPSLVRWYR